MGRGGIETWLMHVLRHIDREKFQIDFLVHKSEPGDYDKEILSLGSRIIKIKPEKMGIKYGNYLKRFREILDSAGPYDVVHAHGGISYGPLLKQAYKAGVPVRVIHSHDMQRDKKKDILRLPIHFYYRKMMEHYATAGLGCSRDACEALYGSEWGKNGRFRVLYYGINLEPYNVRDKSGVRKELGIAENDIAVCHVGRFIPVKNHKFIVDIAKIIAKRKNNFKFILIGDGAMRREIENMVLEQGLGDKFVFTGLRSDVPRLLFAMDMFVMPSYHEGLGLVLVEAQAAGLCCIANVTVPKDVEVIDSLCYRLNINDGAQIWADKLIELSENDEIDKGQALDIIRKSHFNIEQSVMALQRIYEGKKRVLI
jgi:glycosyltransferase involved in cell wall biosynthesis